MDIARIASYAAMLFALAVSSEGNASDWLCFKNHYILDFTCVPPNFQIPAVPAGVNHWTAIGPDGANVAALAIDPATPSTAFAGTLGSGVLKTIDGGASWATVNVGLPTTNVLALAVDAATSSTLYAGTDAGVFKSIDGGRSWVVANTGLDATLSLTVNALAIDPASPGTVYIVTGGRLFKTTDGAASWTSLNGGLSRYLTRLIAIDATSPSTVYIGVDDTINDFHNGVLKSTDGGASWTQIYNVPCEDLAFGCVDGWPGIVALAIDPRSPSRIYVVTSQRTIASSADGGATWSSSQAPADFRSLAVDPVSSVTLYATTLDGSLFRTTDAGNIWIQVADGGLASVFIKVIALTASSPATVYAGGAGIYRSSDGAQTWTHLALGVRTVAVGPFVVDPGASTTIYAAVGSGVMKTTDGGAHWADSADFGSINALAIDVVSPSTLYAAQTTPASGGSVIYKSTDAGAHWTRPSGILFGNGLRTLAIAPTQPSILFVVGEGDVYGVWKSTDGGTSWAPANFDPYVFVSALAVDPTTADIVYAARFPTDWWDTAKILKSTDGAAHWRQVPIDLPKLASITSLTIDPATPSIIYASYSYGDPDSGQQGGVLKSSDGGETWVAASQNLPPGVWVLSLAIDPSSPSYVYAATSAGVFMSADGATSWTPINAGLPNVGVWNLAIDRTGSVLRAATIAGLFEYRLSEVSPAVTVPVIEYYYAGFDHYFISANPEEINALDNGDLPGWTRTGLKFNAYAANVSGTSPVCRFFSTAFTPKSSHFYTPFPAECATRQIYPGWMLESAAAFYVAVPASDGSCAAGSMPVYRLYNNGQGGAPNHRYTTDLTARTQMITQGWAPEGLGADAVEMCSPP